MTKRTLVLVALLLLAACSGDSEPSQDAVATQKAVLKAAAATLTAEAVAMSVPIPTLTPEPTDTAVPTRTAAVTLSPIPTSMPTSTNSPTAPPPPPATDTPPPLPTPTAQQPTALPTRKPTNPPLPTAPPTPTFTPSIPAVAGRIVYSAGGELHIVDARIGQDIVPPIANMAQPDLLADGARIIAKGTGGDRTSLWAIDAHTGALVSEQSQYSDDFHPSWSPDGTHFAYDSLHQGLGNYTLYTQKLNTKVDEAPLFQDAFILGTSPVWMRDDWLAYTGCDYWPDGDGSKCGIYRMPSWGDRPFLIRPDSLTVRATDTFESRLAFMSEEGGDWEVYVMPIQGGAVQNLSNSPSSQDGLGAFAPDGRSLAFVSNRSGAWAIWVVNLDGTGLTRLFDLPAPLTGTWSDEHIAWGP